MWNWDPSTFLRRFTHAMQNPAKTFSWHTLLCFEVLVNQMHICFFQFQYAAYSHLGNRSEESRNTALQPILRGLPQKWQSMARLKWIKRPGWIPLWPLTSHSNWGHDWNELTVMLRSVIWWWSFGLPSKESSGKIVQRRGTRTQDAICRLKLLQALHWMISSRRWEWLSNKKHLCCCIMEKSDCRPLPKPKGTMYQQVCLRYLRRRPEARSKAK